MKIQKVVIPVAGWGTRSLPATKNMPKEMLPVFTKPALQYIVEEAMYAGLENVVFVNNQNKRIIEDHFDYNLALEAVLKRTGKMEMLKQVQDVAEMVNIISVRQKVQLGLGHAVLCARETVGNEPFAVMVGDDLMFDREPAIHQLLDVAEKERMAIVGVMEVPADRVSNYGIIDGEEVGTGFYRVRDVVEKPKKDDAPSRLAIVGRYILYPDVFPILEEVKPSAEGEIELSDALRVLAKERKLLAIRLRGRRFDVGNWVDYLTANIYFGLQDEDLRYDLVNNLKELIP